MNISKRTLDILENFSTINGSILFKKGSVLSTVSPQKNILASANVDEKFPLDFAVYDLGNLLSLISLYDESPTIDFGEKELTITGYEDNRSNIRFRYTDPSLVEAPPNKELKIPSEDISFTLKSKDLNWVIKTAAILKSPNVIVETVDGKVVVSTSDVKDDSVHVNSLTVGDHKDKSATHKIVFKTENIKLLPEDYEVTIASGKMAQFKAKQNSLTYFIAAESVRGK